MSKNTDIFIYTHRPFNEMVKSKTYKIISEDNNFKSLNKLDVFYELTQDNIHDMGLYMSELKGLYWIWKNYPLKKYVGLVHYSRYFAFLDEIPNLNEVFKTYDIIIPTPIKLLTNMYTYYHTCHNTNDLANACMIAESLYPQYSQDIIKMLYSNIFHPFNMFIMKSEDFKNYCEWLFAIADSFSKQYGITNEQDAINYVDTHVDEYKNAILSRSDYQCRIMGFLSERLFNVYLSHNFKNPLCIGVAEYKDEEHKKMHS